MADDPEDPRVALAVERTMLAWVRTGLAIMGFGFVVARLGLFLYELALATGRSVPVPRTTTLLLGGALLAIGALVNIVASVQHVRSPGARVGDVVAPSMRLAAALGIATGLLGIALAAYLATY